MALTKITTKPCPLCGERSALIVDSQSLLNWQTGMLVQNAFPKMSAPERELLITGTHPACWKELFAPLEDSESSEEAEKSEE